MSVHGRLVFVSRCRPQKTFKLLQPAVKAEKAAIAFFSLVVIIAMFFMEETFENRLRGVVSGLLFLKFLFFDSRGLAEDRFIIHPLNIRGILYPGSGSGGTVSGEQGPMDQNEFLSKRDARTTVEIRASNGKLVLFLTEHLNEGTPIDILVDQEPKGH